MSIRSLVVGSSTSIVTSLSRFTRSACICGWMSSSRLFTYHSSSSSIANGKGVITIHLSGRCYNVLSMCVTDSCMDVVRFSRFSILGTICLFSSVSSL